MRASHPIDTALAIRQRGDLAASNNPTPPSRVLLPPGATIRAIALADGVGPFVDHDGARAVFHTPGSGTAQMLTLDRGEVREASLGGLDPGQPHSLHPRRGGLGALDEAGTWHWQPSAEPGHRPESELVSGVLPPGDRVARFARESVNEAGNAVDAISGDGDDLHVAGWSRGGGRSSGAPLAGPFVPPEERSGWGVQLWGPCALVWSPAGDHLAVGDAAGVVILRWDGETLRPQRRLDLPLVQEVAWSEFGLAASGTGGEVRIWDPGARVPLGATLRGKTWGRLALAWSPSGRLATSHDRSIRCWDVRSGKAVQAVRDGADPAHWDALSWSSDHAVVAACGYRVARWTLGSRTELCVEAYEPGGPAMVLALGPSGILATGTPQGLVQVWDPAAPQTARAEDRVESTATCLSWSDDGRLAVGLHDAPIRLLDPLRAGHPRLALPSHPPEPCAIAWSRRGILAAAFRGGAVRVWDPASPERWGPELAGNAHVVRSVGWSASGLLAVAPRHVHRQGAHVRDTVWVFDPQAPSPGVATRDGTVADEAGELTWNGSGMLAWRCTGGCIRVWEPLASPLLKSDIRSPRMVGAGLGWSACGHVVAGGQNGMIFLIDPEGGNPWTTPFRAGSNQLWAVVCGIDARIASASPDGGIRTWRPGSARRDWPRMPGDNRYVRALAWSRDGLLASCGSNDASVHVWSPDSPEPHRAALDIGVTGVSALAWSPRGLLASGGSVIHVWEPLAALPLRAVLPPLTGTSATALAWSDRGVLAVGVGFGPVSLWNVHGRRPRPWSPRAMALHRDLQGLHIHATEGGPWRVPHLLLDADWVVVGPHIPVGVRAAEARCPGGRLVEQDGLRFGVGEGALHVFDAGLIDQCTTWRRTILAGVAPVDWRPNGSAAWPGVVDGSVYADVEVCLQSSPPSPLAAAPWEPLPADVEAHDGLLLGPCGQTLCRLGPGARGITLHDGSFLAVDLVGGLALVHADHRAALRLVVDGLTGPVAAVGLGAPGAGPQVLGLWGKTEVSAALPRFVRAAGGMSLGPSPRLLQVRIRP